MAARRTSGCGSSATTKPDWRAAATRPANSSSCWRTRWRKAQIRCSLQGQCNRITAGRQRPRRRGPGWPVISCWAARPPESVNGNLLLDHLLGATLHWTERENRLNRLAALADELRAAGRRPYVITYGGSDPVGARGYANALEELHTQCQAIGLTLDAIVVPSSSGGTQAGLLAGIAATGWAVPVVGISIDEPEGALQESVARLATDTATGLGIAQAFEPGDVRVEASYLGGGYGVFGELEREAILTVARMEGILLDPVYTGRAAGGLFDILRTNPERLLSDPKQPANVLFWHTGGAPALFAYASQLAA